MNIFQNIFLTFYLKIVFVEKVTACMAMKMFNNVCKMCKIIKLSLKCDKHMKTL